MAPGISALADYATVAVFLDELAVTHVVGIGTLETDAVLVFLDGRPVALAVLHVAFELRAIGKVHDTLAVRLSVAEAAFDNITVLLRQLAASFSFVRAPMA